MKITVDLQIHQCWQSIRPWLSQG